MNIDCANEPCCSFGYCTGNADICERGMKEDFDQCEAASECISGKCTNGRCTSNEIQVSSQLSLNVMIILVFLMLIIVITTCYFAKIKTDQAENLNHYRRQHDRDGNSEDNNDQNARRKRSRRRNRDDRGSHDRNGSSSSDRHNMFDDMRGQRNEMSSGRSRRLSDN